MADEPDPASLTKISMALKPAAFRRAPHTLTLQQKIELMEAINELDQETMRTVLQVVRNAVPRIKDNNDDEIVLEVNELPTDTLCTLYNFVKNVEAAKEADRLTRVLDGRVLLDPQVQKPVTQVAVPCVGGAEVTESSPAEVASVLPLRSKITRTGSSEQAVAVADRGITSTLEHHASEAWERQREIPET